VKRLVWETDKVIPSMLIMMCCTLYSLLLFFVWIDIFAATILTTASCQDPSSVAYGIVNHYILNLPAYFLGVGCMLNLNKWVYFTLRIRAFIRVGIGMHEQERNPINGSTAIPDDQQQTIPEVIEQGSTDEE